MIKKSVFGKEIYEYTGVVHIHTEHSFDAHGSLKEIVEIAQRESIDFLVITDHRNVDIRKEVSSLPPHDVISIIGYEMNDANKNNHYLILDTDEVYPLTITAEEYVKKTREIGGTGFIAHPFEKRRSSRILRTYVWTDWSIADFDGMEIWNYISEWTDKLRIPWNVIPKILFPNSSINRPNKKAVRKWDELNNEGRKIPGLGSVDSHQNRYSFGPLSISFLPHKKLFKTIRTNIQTREPIDQKEPDQAIIEKLKTGNSYIVNYTHADPYMFYCGIESNESGNFALPGEEISVQEKDLYLFIYLQQDCHVKIIHNGKTIHTEYRNKISYPIREKGFYRIEVYIGLKGWLFSNPMYVV
jgi:hypothetical protein